MSGTAYVPAELAALGQPSADGVISHTPTAHFAERFRGP